MKKFLLITLLSIFGGNWAFAQKQDTLRIRVMTYNLRFGELASLEQIAEHIKAFQPDFVALQEVDSKTYRERAPRFHYRVRIPHRNVSFVRKINYL